MVQAGQAVSVVIDYDSCDNTQACHAVCPVEVFEIRDGTVVVANISECIVCFKCVECCPSGAVTVDY
ncbi:MAG: ferredoxin family protein [Acidobacteria bacterium]|nr:ferredoxin family protein [Acidobacteriota bacterium]